MTPKARVVLATLAAVVAALALIVLTANGAASGSASSAVDDELSLDAPSPAAADTALTADTADSPAETGDCSALSDSALGTELAAGGSCGGNTCGKGTYCCNRSCGNCVPFGMSCTQQSCN